ncbi:MAG: hypothetical protein V4787_06935 [Pseudomonadota bacterium]
MFQPHPSEKLNSLFSARPFQGASPDASRFLFVGLDANYAPDIEDSPAFASIVDYHEDGVAFWRQHDVHHPFLLRSYSGDGRRYHQNFSKIGFTSRDAHRVCFTELLHVPTVGRSDLQVEDLHMPHLDALNLLITSGERRHVFLSAGVARLMRGSGRFPWLRRGTASTQPLPVLHLAGATTVYQHLHFSNYGKFQERMTGEATAIAALARE